jgi:hypothetical protein
MSLSVDRHPEAGPFLGRVGAFLGRREAEHNLLFGILDSLGATRRSPTGRRLAEVRETIVALAIRTPPRNLVPSECHTPAVDALADDLSRW